MYCDTVTRQKYLCANLNTKLTRAHILSYCKGIGFTYTIGLLGLV
jgi:hypothetical protein